MNAATGEHILADISPVVYMPRAFDSPEHMAESGSQAEHNACVVAVVTPLATLATSFVEAAVGKRDKIVPTLVTGAVLTGAAVITMFEGRSMQNRAQEIAEDANHRGARIVSS
jgi:hypothetical protein